MVNNETQSALWTKLASFEINEEDATFTFENRLARENGWSRTYSERVMAEYRKFLFLCATAGHPCSPSEPVDEAWHLHMIYTRSYWERLTPILPSPLHHHPSKGGTKESAKFEDWYARTLDSYRVHFGEEPPPDIWPPIGQQLKKHTIPIDTRYHLVIPRRVLRKTAFAAVGASVFLLAAVGWTNTVASIDSGSALLGLLGVFFVGGVLVAAARAAKDQSKNGLGGGSGYGSFGSGCSTTSSSGDSSSGSDSGGGGGGGGCSGGDGGGGCGGGCGGGGCGS
jgi:hypothetical protein